ncbi:PH domain-containing protein [Cellulomonas sp. JZ18]|uniref:PH domain-containing protein n=1 Tax=Cellulomonas sp. JZ18 TaxID=2654191 RepID=UPI0012D39F37|nr:PH domain-containing protein [Cellulomonas sp. JZ18]QGQ20021.1 PH domain-containing protein [Cellulomonas sp. JZ18]
MGRNVKIVSDHIDVPPLPGAPGRERLAPRALAYFHVRSVLEVVLVAVGVGLALLAATGWRPSGWVFAALVGVTAVGLAVEVPLLDRHKMATTSYTVDPNLVYIARGRWWRRTVSISTAQIINVESVQGPILRRFGLVMVRFTCLADVEALGPLTPEVAERVRETVLRAARGDADG